MAFHHARRQTVLTSNSIEVVLVLLSCRCMWIKIHQCPEEVKAAIKMETFVVKCAKKKFNWVDPKSETAQWHRKERWRYCLFYHWDARLSMQQCLEISLIILLDLSCKPDVLSSAPTLTDIMNQEEMNRSSQPVRRLTESGVIPLPAKWETWSHPKINWQSWRRPCHSYYRYQLLVVVSVMQLKLSLPTQTQTQAI